MRKRLRVISICLALLLSLCACDGNKDDSASVPSSNPSATDLSAQSAEVVSVLLPAEPTAGEETQTGDTSITLKGDTAEINGSGAQIENRFITITAGGTYYLSGSFTGQLRVNVTEEKKVTLILNGVSISCADSAPLFILSSPKKTVISTVENSVNILADGGAYDQTIADERDGDVPDAALYSRDDLKLSGKGELYISSVSSRGINCKDDLEIENGSLFVTSYGDGVRGKDSITVTGGSVAIETEGNGLRSSGDETDATKGSILVENGNISITSKGDAIDAENTLTVTGGNIVTLTNGGYENGKAHNDEPGGFGPGGMGGGPGGMRPGGRAVTTTDTDVSAKGLKATVSVNVSGGTISLNCADDAIHSNGDVNVSNGSIYIKTGDDALHADKTLTVSGGNIEAESSYEGAEGEEIIISGGTLRLTSTDDGINAGTSSGGGMGGFGGGFGGSGTGGLTVTGGYTVLNASGDGLDSNNTVTMSGGTLIVYGPTNGGNGPLDYQISFNFTGGTLVATGSAGMAQSVTAEKGGVLAFNLSVSGDTLLNIADESGNSLLCIKSPKNYQCVVFASDTLKKGETYTVFTGGSSTGTLLDGVYTGGEYTGGSEKGEIKAK